MKRVTFDWDRLYVLDTPWKRGTASEPVPPVKVEGKVVEREVPVPM